MHILQWLAVPQTYWAIAIFFLSLWALYALRSLQLTSAWARRYDRAVFVVLTLAAVMALRWPLLFIPGSLNPDEAQMGAQALKAAVDVLPWHGFDGSTGGPFDSYVLALPLLFGTTLTFFWIHLIATLLGVATICALAAGAEALCGVRIGRAAAVVPLTFFALMHDQDFWHYSSELLPVLLATIALAILAFEGARGVSRTSLVLAGVCLGVIPFAKLQTTPIAVYLALLFGAVLLLRGSDVAANRRRLGVFASAFLGTIIAVIAVVAVSGSLPDAYVSYIGVGLRYSQAGDPPGLTYFFAATPGYQPFAWGTFALLVAAAVCAVAAKPANRDLCAIAAMAGLVAVSLACVIAPHRAFPHYVTLLVVPIAALLAVLLAAAARLRVDLRGLTQVKPYLPLALCVLAVLLPTAAKNISIGNPFLGSVSQLDAPNDPVVNTLRSNVSLGATMAVWGWMPQYYVYTRTRMATKDAVTYYEIAPGTYRDYYRQRYLSSFLAHRPGLFVDAVAP
ncbi:MAG: hypothetical protein JWO85_486, partial [Candidatus Eremiobacteraeota bacterium]|nr:hypothetical protein [Candidatus Eremiobacteraeota bacterium]